MSTYLSRIYMKVVQKAPSTILSSQYGNNLTSFNSLNASHLLHFIHHSLSISPKTKIPAILIYFLLPYAIVLPFPEEISKAIQQADLILKWYPSPILFGFTHQFPISQAIPFSFPYTFPQEVAQDVPNPLRSSK